jgi:hypothetical protein
MGGAAFRLVCHPAGNPGPVQRLQASTRRTADGGLAIDWLLVGDLARLRVPGSVPARRRDRLWEHTCFEAFIPVATGNPAYRECNFSPSGEWAAWGFRRYRDGMTPLDPQPPPTATAVTGEGQLTLATTIPPALLPAPTAALRLALAAVIENDAGEPSYWALHHPRATPDFHAPEAVVALLAPLAAPGTTP